MGKSSFGRRGRRLALAALLALSVAVPAPVARAFAEGVDGLLAQAAQDGRAWSAAGDLKVAGGVEGVDWRLDGTVLHVTGPAPLTLANADGVATSATTVRVDPGVAADLTLAGVHIASATVCPIDVATNLYGTADGSRAARGSQIVAPTSLYLKVADGTENSLTVTASGSIYAGIRCGEGSSLVVDDGRDNRDASGAMARVEGDKVAADIVLSDGTVVEAGSHASALDSDNPGYLEVHGGGQGSGIGGSSYEDGGTLTFNGGRLKVDVYGWNFSGEGGTSYSAGIGAGGEANGTATAMTFNGGTIETHGGLHGAGIGAGHSDCSGYGAMLPDAIPTPRLGRGVTYAGDININGGFIESFGGWHGGAFGSACWSTNAGHTVTVTGGTLIPHHGTGGGGAHSDGGRYNVFPDIGGSGGFVVISGGSVFCTDPVRYFLGIGDTAWSNDAGMAPGYNTGDPNDPNKVFMVTIDLSAEIKRVNEDGTVVGGDNLIHDWELLVAGQRYDYGAPHRFYDGKLYLWLPKQATSEQVTVNLSYVDENGAVQKVNPLFRNPGQEDTLKRYVDFELPASYADKLVKPYDGLPFEPYDIGGAGNSITTDEALPKTLSDPDKVTYKYQVYTGRDGEPVGPEVSEDGGLPSDEGVMRLTMTSTQFSDNPDPIYADFKENYWGHRAVGWCEITPVPSRVALVEAQWVADGAPGSDGHDARQAIKVAANISGGFFDDDPDCPVAATCKAPEGKVQLYVDGEAVGEPIELLFEPKVLDGGRSVTLPQNAWRVDNGAGGSTTRFEYTFVPADRDILVPTATDDREHEVTVRYLPSKNYLASANPTEDDDVPSATVRIDPVDPGAEVEPGPGDPDDPDDPANHLVVEQGESEEGDDGSRLVKGTVTTVFRAPTDDDPHPGRVELKLSTASSAPVRVTASDGSVFTAQIVCDEDGVPVRDEAGRIAVTLDPEAVGKGNLTIVQEPNGAYVGTTFSFEVTVLPDASVEPAPAVAKAVVNLTHPDGPTRPGDRLRYTVTASNGAAGSAWTDVVVTDALPSCLKLDGGSAHLTNGADLLDVDGRPAEGDGPLVPGQWRLSAPGADGRAVLEVACGTVYGGSSATVTFECVVADDAVGRDGDAADLSNSASATGTRPNPDQGEGAPPTVGPVEPDDAPAVTPSGGSEVAPGEPADGALASRKTVENLSRPAQAGRTLVGDRLRYTVEVSLGGSPATRVDDVRVADPLPAGIEPVPGTVRLTTPDGRELTVDDGCYDAQTRVLALHCGELWGGESLIVTFEAVVGASALGSDGANVAYVGASVPQAPGDPDAPAPGTAVDPDDLPSLDPDAPGDPDDPGVVEVATPPATPSQILGSDPAPEDVVVTKEVENLDRSDGTTRVGDTVRYRLSLSLRQEGSALMGAVLRDDVPRGLEPVSGSIRLLGPDGADIAVDDGCYDPWSRTLAVSVGTVCGPQTATLVFDALVTPDAVGRDIGNVAIAFGEMPSQVSLPLSGPGRGEPFSPAGGWGLYERTHPRYGSDTVWPAGAGPDGGVLPADRELPSTGSDGRRTIVSRHPLGLLPVTGDGSSVAGAVALAASAASALLVLVRRRRP